MDKYTVTASILNIRREPRIEEGNIIAKTSRHSILELVDKTKTDWWKIRVPNSSAQGFVKASYLSPISENLVSHTGITEVNFQADPRASLASKQMMYKPIGDSTIPFRDSTNIDSKKSTITEIISKLNVSVNVRYQKTTQYTFCNIYAFDYCYFCKAYMPRVWWNQSAIKNLLLGHSIPAIYGETVSEIKANDLHDWFINWSEDFNWQRVYDVDTLQDFVNRGGVGIICAKRKETQRSGHIVVVVPENEKHKAFRLNDKAVYPLQSQAGTFNYNYFSSEKRAWWQGQQFVSFVFYYHE